MPLHLLLGRGAVIASSSSLWLPEGPPLNMKAWGKLSFLSLSRGAPCCTPRCSFGWRLFDPFPGPDHLLCQSHTGLFPCFAFPAHDFMGRMVEARPGLVRHSRHSGVMETHTPSEPLQCHTLVLPLSSPTIHVPTAAAQPVQGHLGLAGVNCAPLPATLRPAPPPPPRGEGQCPSLPLHRVPALLLEQEGSPGVPPVPAASSFPAQTVCGSSLCWCVE